MMIQFIISFFLGGLFGAMIMACLAAGKYDDIMSGRDPK